MKTKKKVITFADAQFWDMKILEGMLPDYWGGYILPWICTHGYEEVRNYRKTLFIQSIVENCWWEGMPSNAVFLNLSWFTTFFKKFIQPATPLSTLLFKQNYGTTKTLQSCGVARNLKRGVHNFHIFLRVFLFGRTHLKLIENQFFTLDSKSGAVG